MRFISRSLTLLSMGTTPSEQNTGGTAYEVVCLSDRPVLIVPQHN
jgi:hypothetical protein